MVRILALIASALFAALFATRHSAFSTRVTVAVPWFTQDQPVEGGAVIAAIKSLPEPPPPPDGVAHETCPEPSRVSTWPLLPLTRRDGAPEVPPTIRSSWAVIGLVMPPPPPPDPIWTGSQVPGVPAATQ